MRITKRQLKRIIKEEMGEWDKGKPGYEVGKARGSAKKYLKSAADDLFVAMDHLEQVGEFDKAYSAMVEDLAVRGMLESTLIIVMSEFGRTPRINQYYGRDHWGTAWSICLGGAGIQRGAVIGSTNDNGTAVKDREVDHGHLFHTYLQAVGVDSLGSFSIGGQDIPVADPSHAPIEELLI